MNEFTELTWEEAEEIITTIVDDFCEEIEKAVQKEYPNYKMSLKTKKEHIQGALDCAELDIEDFEEVHRAWVFDCLEATIKEEIEKIEEATRA